MSVTLASSAHPVHAASAGPFNLPQAVTLEESPVFGDSLGVGATGRHVSRGLAAALAVTLGPFGAHRIYLGTPPKIPLLYSLTFGGFGVLVLIDLGHILFTKDLSRYMDSGKVLMWAGPPRKDLTPP